jgi:hypothetical protein
MGMELGALPYREIKKLWVFENKVLINYNLRGRKKAIERREYVEYDAVLSVESQTSTVCYGVLPHNIELFITTIARTSDAKSA